MASIRRTLSPYNGRHPPTLCQRGLAHRHRASPYSPSQQAFSRTPMSFPRPISTRPRAAFHDPPLGRSPPSSPAGPSEVVLQVFLVFPRRIRVGSIPFGHFDNLRPNDLAVEVNHPHANARFDEPVDLPLSREGSDLGLAAERLGRSDLGKSFDFAPRKQLIVVTPTYNRAMQGYFLNRGRADDDNVYTLELFDHLREIRHFGTWPVAMLAQSKNKAILEGPVCNGTQVIGWNTNEKSKRLRRFHVGHVGVCFQQHNLVEAIETRASSITSNTTTRHGEGGVSETTFIEQVVADESQMEGVPFGCSKIMNWHLHLDARKISYPKGVVIH
ncbi:hypothetical protein MLD38_000979 [Melastoma candidum]|uniref:Uncharacterized protein n=1 Tax=Melastoma candidum TaxID=119954 RepID=A0ACB9SF38_9MYRT|nr:hypothetical protein MLD38_000979 [Melastoma candidum]